MTPDPAILTLTGNLLWERTLDFPDWAPGRTQRATGDSFQVGGKGINVSKMLRRLGVPSRALCFTGGATGDDCAAWLRAQGFDFHGFASDRPTRLGLVVRGGAHPETTFFSPDAPPSADALRACADYLDAQPAGRILAVCGSLPGWSEPRFDPLRAALERWMARGALAVDTYGPPLAWFIARPVALLKINATELRSLLPAASTSAPLSPPALIGTLAAEPAHWAARAWIVTDGPQAVWYRDGANPSRSIQPPAVREVSPTGSGDVLFACLLHAHFVEGRSLGDALAYALPFAAANAAHPGVADFPLP